MTIKKQLLLFSSSFLIMFTGCEDSEAVEDDAAVLIETPTAYTFDSRFVDGESSVSYSGQVVRNLLMNDIKGLIADNVGGGNTATINSMMANDDANLGIIAAEGMNTVQTKYHDISTSELNDRLAAVASYTDPGYGANAQDMIASWVADSELYSVKPGGLDLGQMVQKVMWGAIAYWQGTSKYMSKIETDDNTMADDGDPYTAMEHHWDESFGYFGAARDYNTGYSDDSDRKSDPYYDSNGDGSIDFKSEYNMGWSVTAAKRDVVDASTDYDFTGTIMNAYLRGKNINHKPSTFIRYSCTERYYLKHLGKGCCCSFNPLYK